MFVISDSHIFMIYSAEWRRGQRAWAITSTVSVDRNQLFIARECFRSTRTVDVMGSCKLSSAALC